MPLHVRKTLAFIVSILASALFYMTLTISAIVAALLAVIVGFKVILILFDRHPEQGLGWMVLACLISAAIAAALIVLDDRTDEGTYAAIGDRCTKFFVGVRA